MQRRKSLRWGERIAGVMAIYFVIISICVVVVVVWSTVVIVRRRVVAAQVTRAYAVSMYGVCLE